AFPNPADVARAEIVMIRTQAAQTVRSQELAAAYAHHPCLLVGIERTKRQAHRENLVRSQRCNVAVRVVQHVEETVASFVDESLEARPYAQCELPVCPGRKLKHIGQMRHR